jgi:hypothetical protein
MPGDVLDDLRVIAEAGFLEDVRAVRAHGLDAAPLRTMA